MTATTKAKPKATEAFPSYELPKFELPKFDLPKFDLPKFEFPTEAMPAAFREYAEKATAQAKEAYEKIKNHAEQANVVLEETYTAAAAGATSYGLKLIEVARTNTNAAFDLAQDLLATKSLPEVVEVSGQHGRKQYETVSAQAQELATLAQQVATRTAEPISTGIAKATEPAA